MGDVGLKSWVSCNSDLKNGIQVVTPLDVIGYEVSARTGWPGVSIL